MLSTLVNILLFILVMGFLVFIHEFGHFIVAKAIKTKVYEFALGFGPKLLSKKYKDTEYTIRAIPLGGFVKIMGDGDPGGIEDRDSIYSLSNKPRIQQILVMLAGVTMNLLFAVVAYYIILGMSGWKTPPVYVNLDNVNIKGARVEKLIGYEVAPEGNAEIAGLPEYGFIESIDGTEVSSREDIAELIGENKEVLVSACSESGVDCEEYVVNIDEEGKMGVMVLYGYILDYTDVKPFSGFIYLSNNLKIIGSVLGSMIGTARETGDYSDLSNTVSGPIGIFLLIDYLKSEGVVVFLSLLADLSLSLAIMNLLPIPVLDGGRVLIISLEGIFRKELSDSVKSVIMNVSMVLLIMLIVLIMVKDVINIENMRNMFG